MSSYDSHAVLDAIHDTLAAEVEPQCYCGHDNQDHQAQGCTGTECYAPQLVSGERCECKAFDYWPEDQEG